MAIEENDESMVDEITSETTAVEKEIERQRIEVLLSGEYDSNNAILSFHPGAGGTEAQDWAQMLYRMYVRWGERHGFNVKLVDWLDGEEAGLKSATIRMLTDILRAKTECTASFAYLLSTARADATRPLHRLK